MPRHAMLALLLAAALPLRAEEAAWWQITAQPATVSQKAVDMRGKRFYSPDWGLKLTGEGGDLCELYVAKGGKAWFAAPQGATLKARIVDIYRLLPDINATEAIDLQVGEGAHPLAFPDGSSVDTRIERFDPEASGGAEATPAGARALDLGRSASGQVSFVDRKRTQCWSLTLDQDAWVEGFAFHHDGVLDVEWVSDAGAKGFGSGLDAGSPFQRFRGRLPAGRHCLRVRATRGEGATTYTLLLVRVGDAGKGQGALVRPVLDLVAEGGEGAANLGSSFGAESFLRSLDSAEAREEVVKGFDHPQPAARALSVRVAADLSLTDTLPRLDAMARSDGSARVRSEAASAAKRIRRAKR